MRPFPRSGAWFLVLVAIAGLGLHSALAAANVVPRSRAGDGRRAVSGYVVSQVRHTLSPSDPSRIAVTRFRLNRRANEAYARYPSATTTWTPCVLTGGGRNATCTHTTPVPITAVTSLRVAAAL
jgi:hypothetical protein